MGGRGLLWSSQQQGIHRLASVGCVIFIEGLEGTLEIGCQNLLIGSSETLLVVADVT
jgi:hypothetical protein